MTDIRNRIAAILYQNDGFIVPWTEAAEFLIRDYQKTADAVIREIGLQRETVTNPILPNHTDDHRYVTDWKADDDAS
jgi:hypothetical protein